MKSFQEVTVRAKDTAEIVKAVVNRQFKRLVQLVTQQPKKPPLSWESIIGEDGFRNSVTRPSSQSATPPEFAKVNPHLAQLPPDVFDALFRRIQMNMIDEIKLIRLYEKLFDCEVQILQGHVHFYKCTSQKESETIDYTVLSNRLIELFLEHKKVFFKSTVGG